MSRVDPPISTPASGALAGLLAIALSVLSLGCGAAVCDDCPKTPTTIGPSAGRSLSATEWRRSPPLPSSAGETELGPAMVLALRFTAPKPAVEQASLILHGSTTATLLPRALFRIALASDDHDSLQTRPSPRFLQPRIDAERRLRPGSATVFDVTEIVQHAQAEGRDTIDLLIAVESSGPLRVASPRALDPLLRPRLEVLLALPPTTPTPTTDSDPIDSEQDAGEDEPSTEKPEEEEVYEGPFGFRF